MVLVFKKEFPTFMNDTIFLLLHYITTEDSIFVKVDGEMFIKHLLLLI